MSTCRRFPGRALVLLAGAFAAVMVLMVIGSPPEAVGQIESAEGGNNPPADVLAFPIQLAPGHEGIALIDKAHYTLCIYQYQPTRPAHERLVLLAARSFQYDRLLESFNTASPTPLEVKQLLDRSQKIQNENNQAPAGKDAP